MSYFRVTVYHNTNKNVVSVNLIPLTGSVPVKLKLPYHRCVDCKYILQEWFQAICKVLLGKLQRHEKWKSKQRPRRFNWSPPPQFEQRGTIYFQIKKEKLPKPLRDLLKSIMTLKNITTESKIQLLLCNIPDVEIPIEYKILPDKHRARTLLAFGCKHIPDDLVYATCDFIGTPIGATLQAFKRFRCGGTTDYFERCYSSLLNQFASLI